MSDEVRDIPSGFILKRGDVEINATFGGAFAPEEGRAFGRGCKNTVLKDVAVGEHCDRQNKRY